MSPVDKFTLDNASGRSTTAVGQYVFFLRPKIFRGYKTMKNLNVKPTYCLEEATGMYMTLIQTTYHNHLPSSYETTFHRTCTVLFSFVRLNTKL